MVCSLHNTQHFIMFFFLWPTRSKLKNEGICLLEAVVDVLGAMVMRVKVCGMQLKLPVMRFDIGKCGSSLGLCESLKGV